MTPTTTNRTAIERAVDLLLVLCAAEVCRAIQVRPGLTVLQKVFFALKRGAQSRAPHHEYVRYYYGPYSHSLAADLALLRAQGFVDVFTFEATSRGSEIARHYRQLLEPENLDVFTALDESMKMRAGWTAEAAKREAYRITVVVDGKPVTVREARFGAPLHAGGGDRASFRISSDVALDLITDLSLSASDFEATKRAGRTVELADLEPLPTH